MSKLNAAIMIAVTIVPTSALAQTSSEYVVMGKQSWAQVQCAALAEFAGDTNGFKRLFAVGIAKQRTFIQAQFAGKVEQQDYNREMPMFYASALAAVPLDIDVSVDFELGALWASAYDAARNVAYDPKSNPAQNGEMATAIAKNAFSSKNCSLL
jgi:hypothetical protein